MAIDMDWFNHQVASFEQQRPIYDDFSKALRSMLESAVRSIGIIAIVQVRAKELPSFAEKCIRKRDKYVDPINQFTDLCGGRIIVQSKDQIKPVCDYILEHFEIDEANSEDVIGRLRAGEFGYLSVHYIVSLKAGVSYDGIVVPEVLLARRGEKEANETGIPQGPKYKAEVQVRTLLQHAWADLVHDNLYKSDFKAPRHLEREAGRIAALLEDSDDSFLRLLNGVGSYRSYYGAYMSAERIREEIEILEAVQKHDADNPKLAHKIARLAMAIEDWDKAASTLAKFATKGSPSRAGLLRDLGVALRMKGDPGGQKLIEEAVELNPADVDAHCELGDACFHAHKKDALNCFEDAFRIAPTYPRALRGFIQCKIMHDRSLRFLSLIRPNLEAAIQTSREWAKVGVHLPWAYYDIGFFALLLARPYESLTAFSKAIQLSATESPIEEACRLIEELQDELDDRSSDLAQSLEWTRRFLLVATVGKLMTMDEASTDDFERLRILAERAISAYRQMQMKPDADNKVLAEAKEKADEAERAKNKAREKWEVLKAKAGSAPLKYLANTQDNLKGKRYLVTPPKSGEQTMVDDDRAIIIVAGGCDPSVAQKINEYRSLLESAFKDFDGTIVSGGTTAGISGIVGDLSNAAGKIKKIAYLPKSLPRGDREHEAYTTFEIPGTDYTPFGPIQVWIDLLASGLRPKAVRLIGINGGELSAFEYRLGLVLGATVGILRDSGREATRISDDPEWKTSPGLVLLPTDEETVRLFLQPPPPSSSIVEKDKERLARLAHEEHRRSRSHSLMPPDPALSDWDELPPSFKTSNYQQIDHIEAKLERIGLKVRKVKQGEAIRLFSFEDEFKDDYRGKIEELAQMEHARWNVERLLEGWTLGERDPKKKTSPYLVSWGELPPEEKKWDCVAVTSLPTRLRELGYEIYRPK